MVGRLLLLAVLAMPASAQLTILPIADTTPIKPGTGAEPVDVTVRIECLDALQWTLVLDSAVLLRIEDDAPAGIDLTGGREIAVSVEPCRLGAAAVEGTFALAASVARDVPEGPHEVPLAVTAAVTNNPQQPEARAEGGFNATAGFFGRVLVELQGMEMNVLVLDPAADATVRYAVTNVGNAESSVHAAWQAPANFTSEGGNVVALPVTVAMGETEVVDVQVAAPLTAGQWTVDLTFTPARGEPGEPASRSLTVRTKGPLEPEGIPGPGAAVMLVLVALCWRRR